MNCQEFQLFADAYVDGEFSARERAEMRAHLGECQACRADVEAKITYKEQIKDVLSREEAPDILRERIVDEISQVDRQARRDRLGGHSARRFALAGVMVAAAVAAVVWLLPQVTTVMPGSAEPVPVVENTVDWHRGNFPIEVPGPDGQEVARWFRGKVDFPVRLPSFDSQRVRLIGGRLANVNNKRAAYAQYEVDGSRLSVMIFHNSDLQVPSSDIRQVGGREVAVLDSDGYEVAVLQDDGLTYTMTSNLPEQKLLELVGASLQK